MRATPIVMNHEFSNDDPQVAFTERDQRVETLPADGSHDAFTKRVRPGRSDWSFQRAYAKALKGSVRGRREDGVPVVDHETIRMIESQKLAKLLDGPFRAVGWAVTFVCRIRWEPISIATNT